MSGKLGALRLHGVLLKAVVAAVVVVVGLVVVSLVLGWRPSLPNPFEEKTIDRSSPAVLRSLEDLHEYHAASAHFEVIVDFEKDTRFIPSALKGQRILFIGVGNVDALVDFRGLRDDAVTVSADRLTASIALPHPILSEPRLDPKKSYVFARQQGALDRLGGLLGGGGENDQQYYVAASDKIADAAKADGSIVTLAEQNTTAMLHGLLGALGFTTVTVTYEDNPA